MLKSIFIIFLFQLIGESAQKYFELTVPGPVIGLILLLMSFISLKNNDQSRPGFVAWESNKPAILKL